MVESGGDGLWDFALQLYDRPGVKDACLGLQDGHGLDVNMLLFCVWLGQRCGAVIDPVLAGALEISRGWQTDVIEPLRRARQTLKTLQRADHSPQGSTVDLYEATKSAELAAERLEVAALVAAVERLASVPGEGGLTPRGTAAHNLATYFAAAGVQLDPLGEGHVLRILDVAFGP